MEPKKVALILHHCWTTADKYEALYERDVAEAYRVAAQRAANQLGED